MQAQERQIEIGGEVYTIRFSLKAMVALQDHYGLETIDDVGKRLSDPTKIRTEDFAAIFWAALRSHHPEVTLEAAINLADAAGLGFIQQLGEAFSAAQPNPDPAEAKGGKRRPR